VFEFCEKLRNRISGELRGELNTWMTWLITIGPACAGTPVKTVMLSTAAMERKTRFLIFWNFLMSYLIGAILSFLQASATTNSNLLRTASLVIGEDVE